MSFPVDIDGSVLIEFGRGEWRAPTPPEWGRCLTHFPRFSGKERRSLGYHPAFFSSTHFTDYSLNSALNGTEAAAYSQSGVPPHPQTARDLADPQAQHGGVRRLAAGMMRLCAQRNDPKAGQMLTAREKAGLRLLGADPLDYLW